MNFAVVRQLLTPLCYLRVRGESKLSVDLVAPVVLAALSTMGVVAVRAPILEAPGLVSLVNELLQVLVGFYVAALAAISVFGSVALDQPVLKATLNNKSISRRQFLAYVFGYLALISLVNYCLGVVAVLAADVLSSSPLALRIKPGLIFLYMLLWWNMVTVTLLGLYYLVDRAYRADPIVHQAPGDTED